MWVISRTMKRFLIHMSALIILGGCYITHEEEVLLPPDNLIEIDRMIDLLVEVELAESALRQKQNYGEEITKLREEYYTAIFKQYEVSKEQFDESMSYYKQDMETIDMIYEEVITKLSVIESEVQHE